MDEATIMSLALESMAGTVDSDDSFQFKLMDSMEDDDDETIAFRSSDRLFLDTATVDSENDVDSCACVAADSVRDLYTIRGDSVDSIEVNQVMEHKLISIRNIPILRKSKPSGPVPAASQLARINSMKTK